MLTMQQQLSAIDSGEQWTVEQPPYQSPHLARTYAGLRYLIHEGDTGWTCNAVLDIDAPIGPWDSMSAAIHAVDYYLTVFVRGYASRLARRIVTVLEMTTPGLGNVFWYDGTPDRDSGWADDQAAQTPTPEILDYATITMNIGTVYLNGDSDGVRWSLRTAHEDENGLPYTTEAAADVTVDDIAPICNAIEHALAH